MVWTLSDGVALVAALIASGAAYAFVAPRAIRRPRGGRAAGTVCDAAAGRVGALWRYPIKGFPAEPLERVALEVGGSFPGDRAWAALVVDDAGDWDAAAPAWVHKRHFFGAFRSRPALFDVDVTSASAKLGSAAGRAVVENDVRRRTGERCALVYGGEAHQFGNTRSGVRFCGDVRTIHVVNSASVAAVAAATGLDVTAAVFRPNVALAGLAPWAEEAWAPGTTLRLGGAVLEVIGRTVRCDAINTRPTTGERWPGNRDLVSEIAARFPEVGPYLGFYARVLKGGAVAAGDAAAPIAVAPPPQLPPSR